MRPYLCILILEDNTDCAKASLDINELYSLHRYTHSLKIADTLEILTPY